MQITEATPHPVSNQRRRVARDEFVERARRPSQRENISDTQLSQDVKVEFIRQAKQGFQKGTTRNPSKISMVFLRLRNGRNVCVCKIYLDDVADNSPTVPPSLLLTTPNDALNRL
jgi:hypothetical protein